MVVVVNISDYKELGFLAQKYHSDNQLVLFILKIESIVRATQ